MITLKYKLITPRESAIDPFYLLCEVIAGEADKVRFEIPSGRGAETRIGGKRVRLQNGACEVKFSEITEGTVDIEVIDGGKALFATSFLKTDGVILRLPADDVMYEKLKAAYEELEEKVSDCEKRISDIETQIQPKPMFKFN